jgi:hypothetical protein
MEFKMPFVAANELELQDAIINKPHIPLSGNYSESLVNTVNKMLMKV